MGGNAPDLAGDFFGVAVGGDEVEAVGLLTGEVLVGVGDALVEFEGFGLEAVGIVAFEFCAAKCAFAGGVGVHVEDKGEVGPEVAQGEAAQG